MYLKDKWGKDFRMINEDFERVHFKLHISNCNLCLKKSKGCVSANFILTLNQ